MNQKVKKQIIRTVVIILIAAAIFLLIRFTGCRNLFVPKSVKVVKEDSIDRLESKKDRLLADEEKDFGEQESLSNTYQKLGDEYLNRQNWNAAIANYDKAVSSGQNSEVIQYKMGVAYANRGKARANEKDLLLAEKHYLNSLEMNSQYLGSRYGLALLRYYFLDKKESGLKMINELVVNNPNFYEARFAQARINYEEGRPAQAYTIYKNLQAELNTKPDSPIVKDLLEHCNENLLRLKRELGY